MPTPQLLACFAGGLPTAGSAANVDHFAARHAEIYNPANAVGQRWSGLLADSQVDRLAHSTAFLTMNGEVCLPHCECRGARCWACWCMTLEASMPVLAGRAQWLCRAAAAGVSLRSEGSRAGAVLALVSSMLRSISGICPTGRCEYEGVRQRTQGTPGAWANTGCT